jgi:hypothetical protein
MRLIRLTGALLLLWLSMSPVWASAPPKLPKELGVSEKEAERLIKSGRLGGDEIIRAGEDISWFTKLRFYAYAQELEPYFEGVEDAMRELARVRSEDHPAVAGKRDKLFEIMKKAHKGLMGSEREDPATDWRRGLLGLIFLDQDWRRRVREQNKPEIKNPYDLVALLDCLDAQVRGLAGGEPGPCRVRPAPPPVEKKETLDESRPDGPEPEKPGADR